MDWEQKYYWCSSGGISSNSDNNLTDLSSVSGLFVCIVVCIFLCIEPVYHRNLALRGHSSALVVKLNTIN
jgi:hypothetical protein